jgi:hypothetical protein
VIVSNISLPGAQWSVASERADGHRYSVSIRGREIGKGQRGEAHHVMRSLESATA